MDGFLSTAQIDYVLFHLNHHVHLTSGIRDRFLFVRDPNEIKVVSGRIVFLLSGERMRRDRIKIIEELPVLFPLSDGTDLFHFDGADNLVFNHDILKSAFYLLSGYQEYANKTSKDNLQRFSFTDSIQHHLNITQKPLVNYYFDFIIGAIEKFGIKNHIPVSRRRLFTNFAFMLTHDVDLVDLYTSNFIVYKIKEITGLRKSALPRSTNFNLLVKGTLKYFGLRKNDNPYWNFTYLRELERNNRFRSVFYFLDQGVRHSDAYYSFNEQRIVNLFKYLLQENCEIGLHGSVESVHRSEKMESSLAKLKVASQANVQGIRQHRLLWNHPETAIIQQHAGLKYDTTLGFAAHEGFRNSYCSPFLLYDFANDQPLNLWEFPMNVMDVTLFSYQRYSNETAMQRCLEIIDEIKKFGGVFTLLWHNSFFDEDTYPGITDFYQTLLEKISAQQPENLLGIELRDRIQQFITN